MRSFDIPSDISPDGSEVAYTGVVIEAAEAWTTGWKIFTVNVPTSWMFMLLSIFQSFLSD